MYCIKCGVELSACEKSCPLCQTKVYHPDIELPESEPNYPDFQSLDKQYNRKLIMLILTVICALPAILTTIIDLKTNAGIQWSGYVSLGILILYVAILLPFWFQRPNPVVFVPCTFVSILLLLLYTDFTVQGGWFLSFAFPVTGVLGLIVTALVALLKYVRKGELYIWGGAVISLGLYCVLIELMSYVTFESISFVFWSLYPLVSLFLIGMLLIVIAICKPLRSVLEKKFFI